MFALNIYVRYNKVLQRLFAVSVPHFGVVRTDIWTVRIDPVAP